VPAILDTSALAKLYHRENGTTFIEKLLDLQQSLLVSRLALVKMRSVLSGKVRTKTIGKADAELVRLKFRADVRKRRIRVVALKTRHYELAESLIEKHGGTQGHRTLDSLQLAVALDLARNGVADSFVTADKVLVRVPSLENLVVWDPETASPEDLLI